MRSSGQSPVGGSHLRSLAKVGVAGSSPVSFSRDQGVADAAVHPLAFLAPWPSGKAEDCKSFIPGSNPGGASWQTKGFRGLSPEAL